MDSLTLSGIGLAAVLVLAALRMPLAFALGAVGAVGTGVLKGWDTFLFIVGSSPFDVLSNFSLSVLPMFILMGALAVRTGMGAELVHAANGWLGHRRGGLATASVLSCAGFGAVSGSNLVTLSTMTKITVPEMLRRGYSPKLAAGTLASASTLDVLIPPSIPMVIYASMTESSVGRMLAGGIVPGIVLAVLFVLAIRFWLSWDPEIAPRAAERLPWRTRLRLLGGIWGVALVFIVMIGGMYVGLFSPTEAGAVGAAGVLGVGLLQRRMSWDGFVAAVRESVRLSAVIYLLLIGIALFHFYMDSVGLQREMNGVLAGINLSPAAIMVTILLLLIMLGCVMDAMSILVITTPFLFPVVVALGYDPIWFGVVMIMVIQLGLIHPPFGLNVFILCSMVKEITTGQAFWGCAPFVVANIVVIALVVVFPEIVLWLPNQMFK